MLNWIFCITCLLKPTQVQTGKLTSLVSSSPEWWTSFIWYVWNFSKPSGTTFFKPSSSIDWIVTDLPWNTNSERSTNIVKTWKQFKKSASNNKTCCKGHFCTYLADMIKTLWLQPQLAKQVCLTLSANFSSNSASILEPVRNSENTLNC